VGVERIVRFSPGRSPGWTEIAAKLRAAGEAPVVRMIDGLPAFPDEVPDTGWWELRVGLAGGIITLCRDGDTVRCVAWGTEDPVLLVALDLCARAVTDAGCGRIDPSV
jgi:hypothetical protein